MSKTLSITVHVRPRWWFGPVLKLLLTVHHLTGWAPSTQAIRKLTNLGVRCVV
jgi:hypothetical protein